METVLNLLILQGVLGALDTVYHHELTERLPSRPGARKEVAIHAVRSILYGVVFAGLAWFAWHGLWAWLLAGIILVEVWLTLWDFVVEDQSRKLPATERILHTILAINGGAVFGLLALTWLDWLTQPSALVLISEGWKTWLLTLFAIGVTLSGLRDAWAVRQLGQRRPTPVKFDKSPQRILVTGGTGFIGEPLVHGLVAAGCEVTLLTRDPLRAAYLFQGKVRCIRTMQELSSNSSIDAVINLAGAPVVGGRWNAKRRNLLLQSRIATTQALTAWIQRARQRPRVLIQASAVGFYGCQPAQQWLDESAPPGQEFMSDLCQQWEQHAAAVDALGVRRVTLRLGLVFGASGGALPMLILTYRLGLGALLGNGRQAMSWIHLEDVLALIARGLYDPSFYGIFNAVAPEPLTQATFARNLGIAVRRPVWLRIPARVLYALLGEMARVFVEGQQAIPKRLQLAGYRFRYPSFNNALKQIMGAST